MILLNMTYLIIGQNLDQQKEQTLQIIQKYNTREISKYDDIFNIPDIHILRTQEDSIKIDEVRDFLQSIKFKPFEEKYQFAIIEQAQKLTTESQNALLKTLEEQNDHTNIILQISSSKSILDTILSRGKKLYIQDKKSIKDSYTLKLTSQNLIEKFKQVEELSKLSKQEILEELSSMSNTLSNILQENHNEKSDIILNYIDEIEKAYRLINSNGNKKLVLENLVIQTSNIK